MLQNKGSKMEDSLPFIGRERPQEEIKKPAPSTKLEVSESKKNIALFSAWHA